MSKADGKRVALALLVAVLKVAWVSAMVIIPLLGMWLSSSLAAYRNSSLWVSLAVGLALFPIAPLAWDGIYIWRRRRAGIDAPHILTRLDRLVLRTLFLNVAFIAITLWSSPATAFRALATRGDWMLEGRTDAVSETIRGGLFAVANTLEGFYGRAEENHFGSSDTAPPDPPPEPPAPIEPDEPAEPDEPGAPEPTFRVGDTTYPRPIEPHPVLAELPENPASYQEVARLIGDKVSEPFERVKALHDFVVARLTYDHATFEALEAGADDWPSQEAADVFAAKTAVCAGYSKLLAAMGGELGIEIAFVVGRGGRDGWEVDGVDHAWNAAKIDGQWYLIDATWNDGQDHYDTAYLFTPPELFRLDHLPEDERWQLHPEVLSLADFMRQPMISAQFVLFGMSMKKPDRAQVTVGERVEIVIDNPRGAHLLAKVKRKSGDEHDCTIRTGTVVTRIICAMPGAGRHTVDIYGRMGSRTGSYPHIAKLFVNSK